MTFNAPFVHHTDNAQKLQKLANFASGAGIIVGIVSFFAAGQATGSMVVALATAAIIIIGSLLAGGVAHAIFAIMEIIAKMANEDAARAYRERQKNVEKAE
ncbi:hypothetical protein QP921_09090 [Corynebacterium pseudodiphtheriticum]|uniref:hypothetical protein n=1 Tax=Corynebacterium pseudodiphtheriticum TaxID=37637 RepID=UPI00223B5AB0|nr:hypothetical protein [Corynebacterium pseudodiphtheriticum]MCT1635797.1 hypothetical protein [Corynebacterium pseudodiphtheriticum]MCT1666968.1 hypothetical protein [Corynebacterium pseudodiphtheriticum]MDC7088889.1 hypothetical protein [Corynebacterium pseudodiphtheriticum]MDK4322032.1 hypothetical protein [Corynebacterium pseudodiphtheriticum]MDK8700627.1 hypothetical protein [Corynebacterium pseudodiphtheriticum]